MHEALAGLNDELNGRLRVALRMRTGINTGEVVAGNGFGTVVTGDSVNVAARLEQEAAPGEILLGRETYQLVRDAVSVSALEPLEVKGKATAVPAYRLLGLNRSAPALERRLTSPLVDREYELALLREGFRRVVAERTTHVFTVLG